MDVCVSFKIKQYSDVNVTEYRARCNTVPPRDCVYLRHIMDMLGYKQDNHTPIIVAEDNTSNACIFLRVLRALVCTTGRNIYILASIASENCRNQESSSSTRSQEKINQQTSLKSRCLTHHLRNIVAPRHSWGSVHLLWCASYLYLFSSSFCILICRVQSLWCQK